MPDLSRVNLYLGNAYHGLNRGDRTAEAAMKHLIQADHTFREEAEAKLVTLTPAILQRDHVSRIYLDILKRTLNGD